jgi:undecaprenyl pyrophosphate synthase
MSDTATKWRQRVAGWRASGETAERYSTGRGFTAGTLRWWASRLQGQYLAFIATYTLLNQRPPAEADFQRFFQVTPPAVHQMILELERRGLISRVHGQARTM